MKAIKKIIRVIWYIFLFVFFVGGFIAVSWDYAKRQSEINDIILEHRQNAK